MKRTQPLHSVGRPPLLLPSSYNNSSDRSRVRRDNTDHKYFAAASQNNNKVRSSWARNWAEHLMRSSAGGRRSQQPVGGRRGCDGRNTAVYLLLQKRTVISSLLVVHAPRHHKTHERRSFEMLLLHAATEEGLHFFTSSFLRPFLLVAQQARRSPQAFRDREHDGGPLLLAAAYRWRERHQEGSSWSPRTTLFRLLLLLASRPTTSVLPLLLLRQQALDCFLRLRQQRAATGASRAILSFHHLRREPRARSTEALLPRPAIRMTPGGRRRREGCAPTPMCPAGCRLGGGRLATRRLRRSLSHRGTRRRSSARRRKCPFAPSEPPAGWAAALYSKQPPVLLPAPAVLPLLLRRRRPPFSFIHHQPRR